MKKQMMIDLGLSVLGLCCTAWGVDLTWTGAESATWDTTALNWQDANGAACAWTDGSTAVFPSECTVTNITVSGEVQDGAELQIDLDAEGHSDCLSYAGALDLSKLRFVVNDPTKFNKDCKYMLASALVSCTGEFDEANLPSGWLVRSATSGGKTTLKIAFQKGTAVIFH